MNVKTPLPLLLATVLSVAVSSLNAAEKPAPAPKPNPKSAQSVSEQVVKEININGIVLSSLIDHLKSTCPGFQAVIVRDAGCTNPDPTLPNMSLKNVSLGQILELIARSCPKLEVDAVSGEQGEVWIFRIRGPGGAESQTLQVYRLRHLIDAGVPKRTERSDALNAILSLVQAALEATGSKDLPPMKVHEATETLIFKGSLAQVEVVSRALKALEATSVEIEHSKQLEQAGIDRDKLKAEIERLEKSLARAEAEASDARKRLKQQVEEIELLQARLRARGEKSQ